MTATLQQTTPVSAKLKIQVPARDVNARFTNYFSSLATRAKVPGFRPGKAPQDVVKKLYKQESASDLSERLISEFLVEAIREHKLDLVLPPVLIATDMPEENRDFTFEVEVHLKPTLPALNLKGLTIEMTSSAAVADADIEKEIETLREADASYVDIKETRPAALNDCVVVSFDGSVDGKSSPGMKSESQTLVLGKRQFLPEFEEAAIGLKVGESKKFDLPFPEKYHEPSLQGKTAQFEIKILNIKEKILPAIDDEFAKAADPKASSLSDLRTRIRQRLEEHHQQREKERTRDLIGDALVERHVFEVSPRQVEALAEKLAEQTHHMMHQMGLEHEESEEHFKSLMESSLKKAERDLRLSYILEAIGKEQKFEASDEDIQKRMEIAAARSGLSIAQVKAHYAAKDEGAARSRLDRLKSDVVDEKSLDYAASVATIKMKGPTSS